MADTTPLSSTIGQSKRWLALPVALLVALAGATLLWRRGQQNVALVPPVRTMPEPIAAPIVSTASPHATPSQPQSPLRWLLYLGITIFFVVLLILLEQATPALSAVLFILVLIVAFGYGGYRAVTHTPHFLREGLLHLKRLRDQYADAASFFMVGIAFCCAIGSTIILKESISFSPVFGQALLLFAISLAALGLAPAFKSTRTWVAYWNGNVDLPIRQTQPFHWRRAFAALAATFSGIILLFLLSEINFNVLDSSLLEHVHHVVQFAFLILGIVLLIVGIGGRVHLPVMTRSEVMLLTGLLLFALVLRYVALDTVIPRYIDEVNFMEAIPRLWANPDTHILMPFSNVTAFTWVYPMLQSGISNIVGSGLIGLRLISTVFGTLGVLALYFLVRTLFHDKWLAFASALILATLPAHLHFSRLGLNNIADPFFGTLALAFLMRAFQSHRRSDYVIAGAALGLTQYFYEGGRLLFPPLFVAAFIVTWLLSGRRKADLIQAGYALLVAVLIAAPVYYTLIGTGSFLTPRLQSAGLASNPWSSLFDSFESAVALLRERLLRPLMMYTSIPDQSWFYGGTQAIVIMPFVPVFLLGAAYALRKLRSPAMIILLLWIVMTALGNSFLRESLSAPRYVVAFPAVAVLVAMGLYATLALLRSSSKSSRWFYVAFASLTILIASAQTIFYFRDQAPYINAQYQEDDWIDAFFRMVNLPSGTHVHFIMDHPMWNENVIAFLGYHRLNLIVDELTPDQVTTQYLVEIASDKATQHVFFMRADKKDMLAQLQHYFTLDAPQFSTGITPMQYQLALYKAHAS